VAWSFSKSNLKWYKYSWAALPMALVVAGGLIGGARGGAREYIDDSTKTPDLVQVRIDRLRVARIRRRLHSGGMDFGLHDRTGRCDRFAPA
jgi:hypothetical protein